MRVCVRGWQGRACGGGEAGDELKSPALQPEAQRQGSGGDGRRASGPGWGEGTAGFRTLGPEDSLGPLAFQDPCLNLGSATDEPCDLGESFVP